MKVLQPFQIVILSVLVISAIVSCESDHDTTSTPLPTIRDTLEFYLHFTANDVPYSFHFKPGDHKYTSAIPTYETSGWTSWNGGVELSAVGSYLQINDASKEIETKIGFYFAPSRVIEGFGIDDRCGLLEEDADKYFTTGTYSFCDSWGGFDEFPQCMHVSKDRFYFEMEVDTLDKVFVSARPAADSYFKINKFYKLPYADKTTTMANFDWVIDGNFKIQLLSYDKYHPNAKPDTLKIEDGNFKIGVRNLCM